MVLSGRTNDAEVVAQRLARLAGVFGAARPVLEPPLDHALCLHAARELAESEHDVFVAEPSKVRGRGVDGAKVALADESAELFRAAFDAEREREQVREHDDLELGVEAEHEAVDEHAAERLVVAVLERRVEERRVERGAGRRREVDGGEVRPELVDEHVLQVPDDAACLGQEAVLADDARLRLASWACRAPQPRTQVGDDVAQPPGELLDGPRVQDVRELARLVGGALGARELNGVSFRGRCGVGKRGGYELRVGVVVTCAA